MSQMFSSLRGRQRAENADACVPPVHHCTFAVFDALFRCNTGGRGHRLHNGNSVTNGLLPRPLGDSRLGLTHVTDAAAVVLRNGGRRLVSVFGKRIISSSLSQAAAPGIGQGGPSRHKGATTLIPGKHGADGAALPPRRRPGFPRLQASTDASERLLARGLGHAGAGGPEPVGSPSGKRPAADAEQNLRGRLRRREDVPTFDNSVRRERRFRPWATLVHHVAGQVRTD